MIVYDELGDVTPQQWELLSRHVGDTGPVSFAFPYGMSLESLSKELGVKPVFYKGVRMEFNALVDPMCPVYINREDFMVDENPDYISVFPAVEPRKAVVAVMHFHKDAYIQTRVSQKLSTGAALALAASWAEAMKLEIR